MDLCRLCGLSNETTPSPVRYFYKAVARSKNAQLTIFAVFGHFDPEDQGGGGRGWASPLSFIELHIHAKFQLDWCRQSDFKVDSRFART